MDMEKMLTEQVEFFERKLKQIENRDKQLLFALLRNVTILEQKAIDNNLWCGVAYKCQSLEMEIQRRILK